MHRKSMTASMWVLTCVGVLCACIGHTTATCVKTGTHSGGSSYDCRNHGLTAFPSTVWESDTTYILLRYNRIPSVPNGTLTRLKALTHLLLYDNAITAIPFGVFSGLTTLTYLWLANNKITVIEGGALDGLTALISLWLTENRITALPNTLFSSLVSVQDLWLNNNDITAIPNGLFDNLANVETLWLYNNAITAIPNGAFDDMTTMQSLSLNNNLISAIPFAAIEDLPILNNFVLNNNQLGCDDDYTIPIQLSCSSCTSGTFHTVNCDGADFYQCGADCVYASPTVPPTAPPSTTASTTISPTQPPTSVPSHLPTTSPTTTPTTASPSTSPTTISPTQPPTVPPTRVPTRVPTTPPTTTSPTTSSPSSSVLTLTLTPTQSPTLIPTGTPTFVPTTTPTVVIIEVPTCAPDTQNNGVCFENNTKHCCHTDAVFRVLMQAKCPTLCCDEVCPNLTNITTLPTTTPTPIAFAPVEAGQSDALPQVAWVAILIAVVVLAIIIVVVVCCVMIKRREREQPTKPKHINEAPRQPVYANPTFVEHTSRENDNQHPPLHNAAANNNTYNTVAFVRNNTNTNTNTNVDDTDDAMYEVLPDANTQAKTTRNTVESEQPEYSMAQPTQPPIYSFATTNDDGYLDV